MSSDRLGPKPEPQIEPGEPNPGGVDAVDADSGPIAIPDLTVDENPALDDKGETVKEGVREGEDTSTEATRDEDGEDTANSAKEPTE
jgi:hypothetical protein